MSAERPVPVPETTPARGRRSTNPRPPLDDPRAPRLTFTTEHLRGPEDLGAPVDAELLDLLAGRQDAVSWVRHGLGMVGWGRALTLAATGEERIAELRRAWRGVVGAASWNDDVHRPGTGPVALGAIAFAPHSRARSVLVVPEILVGRDVHGWWMTTATPGPSQERNPGLGQEPDLNPGPAQDPGPPQVTTVEPGALAPGDFEAAVAEVSALLRAGTASKVVLARDVSVRPGAPTPTGDLLSRLGRAYPSCWTFAVDGLAGATPELLVRLDDRQLSSRVLAGTARRRADSSQAELDALAAWLSGSPKNCREHELARDSAVAALRPLCEQVSVPARPTVLRLPNVLHLASDITGMTVGDTGVLSLVWALHPTAAVCGTPTSVASEIITRVEPMDRRRYSGPVGWVDWQGAGEWCIALRCGERLVDGRWRVFGGGGIMPDSDPADELAETAAKMRPMLEALGAS